MTLVESVRTCFQKYFDFSGRAPRSEFWWFFLTVTVAQAVLGVVLPGIAFLVLLLPYLAVSARRLHDTGRSAWWLLSYVVGVGATIVLAATAFVMAFAGEELFNEFDFESGEFAAFAVLVLFGLAAGVLCWILPLVLCALPGTAGPNRYGDDPLAQHREPAVQDLRADEPAAPPPTVDPGSRPSGFCAQCGTAREPGAKFCASCGAAV